MTPRDVIAQHLCDCPPTILTTFAAEATARRIEGVLSTAGFVIVPRKAPARWSRDHQQRWAGFLKAMLAAAEPDKREDQDADIT